MRLDIVSIFPEYLAPLELSLIGKARVDGLVDIRVHDLRDYTHDRHRTVDDTPYGGGAGMVMRPEPWGEALDVLLADSPGARLLVPSPSGIPLTQSLARELATAPHLVIACGRYEGIDERVVEYYSGQVQVTPVSLGDYVLNGGEVAALAMVEAVVRLLPGVVGNAESLVEESHEDGLLEYPVYTKPSRWRDLDVPPVLLSGDHAAIKAWRQQQSALRTASRRPDLLPLSATTSELAQLAGRPAVLADAGEIFTLTKACWVGEIQALGVWDFPPVTESIADARADLSPGTPWQTWVWRSDGRLVASVRGKVVGDRWHVGRLMVAPDLQGRGLGRELLEFVEAQAPAEVVGFELVAGARSHRNQRMYKRAGYRVVGPLEGQPQAVVMTKRRVAK